MRPVQRGNWPVDKDGNKRTFKDYVDARGELIDRLGEYCSYCETLLNASLAVEHIQSKDLHPERETDWHNFLLACVNCNSTKGKKDVDVAAHLWPDRDNTARAFVYGEGGTVRVAPALPPDVAAKAEATRKLVGLDKQPNNDPAASDRRWNHRRDYWGRAIDAKEDLAKRDDEITRRRIVREATALGYWSIWMAVFEDDQDMRRRLIEAFPGTALDCFEAATQPVPRPGGAI